MRPLPPLALAGLIALALGGTPGRAAADDKDALQGKWAITKVELPPELAEVQPLIDGLIKDLEVTVKGDVVTASTPDKKDPGKATFKLDPAKTPKHVDLAEVREKAAKDAPPPKPAQGIYKLDGDALVVAVPLDDALPRPTEFRPSGQKGDKAVVVVLHLKKAK